MTDLPIREAIGQLTAVLDEAFEHPPKPWSYFTDPSPDAGYIGTLAKLSAAEAREVVGGTSIAGQVQHVIFAMEASAAFIQGNPDSPSLEQWQQSWQVQELDDTAWAQMQQDLRDAYQRLRRVIESDGTASAQSFGGAIGAIAHVAYHLGAIKQKIAARDEAA